MFYNELKLKQTCKVNVIFNKSKFLLLCWLILITYTVTPEFKRKNRNIKVIHQKLISSSVSVAKSLNSTNFQESLGFYLAAIAFPSTLRKMIKTASEENPEFISEFQEGLLILNRVEEAFIRYNKIVFQGFFSMSDASYLLLKYLETVDESKFTETHYYLRDMASNAIILSNNKSNLILQNAAVKVLNLIIE